MDTVIGEYTTFVGNVDSEGSLKILGKVEGDVKAGETSTLSPLHPLQEMYMAAMFI